MLKNTILISTLTLLSLAFFSSNLSAQQAVHDNVATQHQSQFKTRLSNTEFNELLIASLASDPNGQQLLAVSDSFTSKIFENRIEISAAINLDKVEQVSPEARQGFEKFDAFLFFLNENKLNITVIAEPAIHNGLIGIRDNFSIKLGPIPIANNSLRQLGVDVGQANNISLKLNGFIVKTISLEPDNIVLGSDIKPVIEP